MSACGWGRGLVSALTLVLVCASAGEVARGELAFGFGVAVPLGLPIAWSESFSFLTAEAGAEGNMSFRLSVGTYPAEFPDLYEADASLLVKGWLGPALLYAGGGFSLEWRRIGQAWLWSPLMNLMAGTQLWLVDSVALCLELRSLERLPAVWVLDPEISLGITLGLGPVRPSPARVDAYHLWILVGLGVLTFILYCPRI